MSVRQEQVVFAVVVLFLAYLGFGDTGGARKRTSRSRGEGQEYVDYEVPFLDLALPRDGRDSGQLKRAVFLPPQDTLPLPPLALEAPPLPPLPGLRPPPTTPPGPEIYGDLLRTSEPVTVVEGLFATEEEDGANPFGVDPDEEDDLSALSADDANDADLTPEEREEQTRGFKRLYDWIRTSELRYGQIMNDDRFSLQNRPEEPIRMIFIDQYSGVPKFSGQVLEVPRDTIEEFGFADNIPNQIELGRLEFGDDVSPSEYHRALEFARWCVDQWLETPRALEVAEEIFTMALQVSNDDPEPKLGIARCYEAGFQFEKAYQLYKSLLAAGGRTQPIARARLGRLYARFRLFDRAEAELSEADRFGRTQWEVQWSLGRFLYDRGRYQEALPHLRLAKKNEPADSRLGRAQVRVDLGAALVAAGELDEAEAVFQQALDADEKNERAKAGLASIAFIRGAQGVSNGSTVANGAPVRASTEHGEDEVEESAGFELLLARALVRLGEKDYENARAELELAAQADPLQAYKAWRALSWLAERTGYPEEARRYAELAFENDPTDPYTLFQRGRLLAADDDVEGAMGSFRKALDQVLDLPDALAALGELSHRVGDYPSAERYLDRAIANDAKMVDVLALSGLNHLQLGQVDEAVDAFEAALALEREHPVARNGLAWSYYVRGDTEEALTRFADLSDMRRRAGYGDDDPQRLYAEAQIVRIRDHETKRVWTDRFDRRVLANGWITDGVDALSEFQMRDGAVVLEGQFSKSGRVRMFRELPANQFVAFQVTLNITGRSNVRLGIFVAREEYRRQQNDIQAEVTVSRHKEGGLQTRFVKRGSLDDPYDDVPVIQMPEGEPVPMRIERFGEGKDATISIFVDGIPVATDVSFSSLGTSSQYLRMGVFVEGETGRSVSLVIDDAEVVFRQEQ